MTSNEFWNNFLLATGKDSETVCTGDLNFDSKGFTNDAEVTNILSGNRTAFFSSFASFSIDMEPLPSSGELYIVYDRANEPRAVIELENVTVIPFCDVSWSMAQKEGEDENLEQWQIRTQEYLTEEGEILGFEFSKEMKLVFQSFRVLYK